MRCTKKQGNGSFTRRRGSTSTSSCRRSVDLFGMERNSTGRVGVFVALHLCLAFCLPDLLSLFVSLSLCLLSFVSQHWLSPFVSIFFEAGLVAVFASSAFCLFLFPPALLAEVAQGLIGFWFSSTCLTNSLLACLLGMGHFGTYAVICLFIATCLFVSLLQ